MYITHTHTHTYRKYWLTNRLNLLIILNLISKPFAIKIRFPLSLWTLLLLPPSPPITPCSLAGQPIRSCCWWFFLTLAAALSYKATPWFLPTCFCRPSSHYGYINSSIVALSNTQQSGFIEAYKHQLSLLPHADEAISSWSRCFPLY